MNITMHPAQTAYSIAKQAHLDRLASTITNAAQQGYLYTMFETVDMFREDVAALLTRGNYKFTVDERMGASVRFSIDFSFENQS